MKNEQETARPGFEAGIKAIDPAVWGDLLEAARMTRSFSNALQIPMDKLLALVLDTLQNDTEDLLKTR